MLPDPRRSIVRDEDRLDTSYIKTFGVTAAIGIGGVTLAGRMANQRAVLQKAITHAREKYEKAAPLFRNSALTRRMDTKAERIEEWIYDERYDPYTDWAEVLSEPEFDGYDWTTGVREGHDLFDQFGPEIEDIVEKIEAINRQLEGGAPHPTELGEKLINRLPDKWKKIEKEYPGMRAIFNKVEDSHGMRIDKIDEVGTSYRIHVTDGARKDIVELPKIKSGIVNWKGSNYKPRPSAQLGIDTIVLNSFGFNVTSRVDEQLKFLGTTSPTNKFKRMIDNVVSINLGKYVDNGHIIKHLLTEEFIFENLAETFGGPSASREEMLAKLPQIMERSKIYMQMGGKTGLIDINMLPDVGFGPRISKGSIRSISEPSFMKFAGISEIPFGIWTFTPWSKVSQARANFIAGQTLQRKMSAVEIAAKLGPTATDVVDHLSHNMHQSLPGKMTNVGFYFGGGEIHGVGKGGALWIDRYMGNVDGSFTSKMNRSQYMGSFSRRYSIPLYKVHGATMDEMKVGVSQETKQLIDKWLGKGDEIKLRKGMSLGPKGGKDRIVVENDARVTNVRFDRGYLDITVEEEIPLHQGTKFDQGKAMIQRTIHWSQIHDTMPGDFNADSKLMATLIGQNIGAELGIETLMNGDMTKKYQGGALGWGVMQKTMNDLIHIKKLDIAKQAKTQGIRITQESMYNQLNKHTNELKELLRTAFGSNIDEVIQEVTLDPETLEPVVLLRPTTEVAQSSSANAAFARVLDVENAIIKAQNGDWREINQLEKKLQKHIDNVAGKKTPYRMILDVSPEVQDFMKLANGYSPTFVRETHTDGKNLFQRLIYLGTRTPEMVHQTSAYEYMSFAGLQRSKSGYAGGFKATIDHIENARAAGLRHYERYLHMLMDYNVDYIRDKMFAAEARMFGGKLPDSTGTHVTMGAPKALELTDDLAERLAQYRVSDDAMKMAGRWRIISRELSGLQGLVSDEAYSELINTGYIDFDDLRSTTKAGMGRFSVDVTDKNLVHDLVELTTNIDSKDNAVYMKLPASVQIDGKDVDFVPIHRFDKADMFELVAERSPDGMFLGERMTKKFYTGSEFYSNQMQFLKKMGQIQTDLRTYKQNKQKTKELREEMKIAVKAYYDNLRNMTKGKFSNIKSAIFEHRMPFSTRGIVNSLSIEQTPDYKVQGLSGIPTDSIYMHEDDVVKLITGGRVKGMREAEAMVGFTETLVDIQSRLKGLNIDDMFNNTHGMGADATKDIYDTVTHIARTLNRLDYGAVSELRDLDVPAIHKKSWLLQKQLRGRRGPLSDKHISALQTLVKDIEHLAINSTEIKDIPDIERAASIYRYAFNTVEQMKEGTLDLQGRLQGSPELSQLSSDHFKLKVLQGGEYSQAVMNDHMRKYVKKHSKYFQRFEGRIYGAKEMIDAMARDFDFDPIGFIVTTLDVLEKESNKITGYSIMKEAGLFGKSSNVAKMELFHQLTEETLIENIMSRLGIVSQLSEGELPKPASPTAITTMHALAESMQDGRALTRDLREYVEESIKKMFTPEELGTLAKGYNISPMNTDKIVSKVLKQVEQYRGMKLTPDDLKIFAGVIPDYGVGPDDNIIGSKVNEWTEFTKKYPDLAREKFKLAFTEDELIVRDKIMEQNKSLHQQYVVRLQEESERFRLIKEQTPTAYNHAKALFSLSYGMVQEADQKEFLTLLADKVISQNTISSKHGTPQVLPELTSIFRELSDTNGVVLDKLLDDLADGNVRVTLTDHEKKEMKRLGHKVEEVDFNTYEGYLAKREAYLTELADVHRSALQEVTRDSHRGSAAEKLSQEYRNKVSAKIDASSALKGYNLPDMYYDDMVVSNELQTAREAVKNAKKYREVMTMRDVMDRDTLRARWARLGADLKEYSDTYKRSVFDDPGLKVYRSYEGGPTSIYDVMMNKVFNKAEHLADDASDHVVRARNTMESWVARVAALISNNKHIEIGGISQDTRQNRMRILASKEVRNIQRLYSERIAEESTVFRSGSILNSMRRRVNQATGSATEDALLNRASKLRSGKLLVGLLAGTILGQAVNQIVGGYPVPDLKGTVGLGGEYYENRTGLMGREMEVMLSPKAPRVVNGYSEDARMLRDFNAMDNMQAAYGSRVHPREYNSPFKGSIVV